MALAYISYAGMNNSHAEFYADIGTNKYYRYRIGNARDKVNGLDTLDDVVHQSELFTQEHNNPFNSRFLIKVPASLFTKNRQYLQLTSYAGPNGKSPAVSQVVEVYPQADLLNNDWPLLSQSKQMSMPNNHQYSAAFNNCRSTGFSFEESRFSNAMFWDSLLQAAKVLAPIAINAVGNLMNQPAQPSPAGTATPPSQGPTTTDIMKLINAVIAAMDQQKNTQANQPQSTTGTNNGVATKTPDPVQAVTKSLSFSNGFSYKKLGRQKSFRDHKRGFARQQFVDGGVLTGPLLASLIGPLVQQAPQLLQVLGDTPIKWLNAKNEGDLKKQVETNRYLSELLAQHNRNALLNLLANTGQLNLQNPPVAMSFSNDQKLKISFDPGKSVPVSGKQKFVYRTSTPAKLLLHINTSAKVPDRPIPKAIVQLEVKEAISLKLVFEKKYRMKDVYLNSMLELELLPQELQSMPLNTDLLVTASFIWQSKSAKTNKGTSEVHTIYLVNDYFLTGTGTKEAGDIPLTDMNKYRVFWNKIWEGSSKTRRRWTTSLDAKYYIYYRHDADSNGRIETKLKIKPQDDEANASRLITEGKLKSGLEVSPVELNKLITEISHFPSLNPEQLQAFRTDDLQKQFNQQAGGHLEMKGVKDETGVIWAYPEVAIHKFTLGKVDQVDEKGQVTGLTEETIHFPCLTSIHFAGLKTV